MPKAGLTPLAWERPGVDRLVGVHVLAVADGHLAQGVGAVEAVVEAVEGRGLPGGAVDLVDAAALDDLEQAVGVGGVDAPAREAVAGHRQQPAQDELGRRRLADARPVEARVDAVLARPS